MQVLGFECTGYDDLSDEWHKSPANRKKILDFINGLGMTLDEAKDGDFSYEKETFDMFMTHDVMEHMHDSPKDILIAGLEAVKPEGYLYITVPNAVNIKKRINVMRGITNHPPYDQYYWYPKPWRGHVREYSRQDLVSLTEYLDCDIVELRAIHHMMEKVPAGFVGLYKLVTTIFPDWRDTWQLVAKKRKNWNPKRALTPKELQVLMGSTGSEVMNEMYGSLVEDENLSLIHI